MDSELPIGKMGVENKINGAMPRTKSDNAEEELLFKMDRVMQMLLMYLQESLGVNKGMDFKQPNGNGNRTNPELKPLLETK